MVRLCRLMHFYHYYFLLSRLCLEKDQILIKHADLSQKLELLRSMNHKESNENEHKKSSTSSFVVLNEENELGEVKILKDELNEKNKVNIQRCESIVFCYLLIFVCFLDN